MENNKWQKQFLTVKFYSTISINQLSKLQEQICVVLVVTSTAVVPDKATSGQPSCILTFQDPKDQEQSSYSLPAPPIAPCTRGPGHRSIPRAMLVPRSTQGCLTLNPRGLAPDRGWRCSFKPSSITQKSSHFWILTTSAVHRSNSPRTSVCPTLLPLPWRHHCTTRPSTTPSFIHTSSFKSCTKIIKESNWFSVNREQPKCSVLS